MLRVQSKLLGRLDLLDEFAAPVGLILPPSHVSMSRSRMPEASPKHCASIELRGRKALVELDSIPTPGFFSPRRLRFFLMEGGAEIASSTPESPWAPRWSIQGPFVNAVLARAPGASGPEFTLALAGGQPVSFYRDSTPFLALARQAEFDELEGRHPLLAPFLAHVVSNSLYK